MRRGLRPKQDDAQQVQPPNMIARVSSGHAEHAQLFPATTMPGAALVAKLNKNLRTGSYRHAHTRCASRHLR